MRDLVTAAIPGNHEILVPGTVELRDLRLTGSRLFVCGLISYEGVGGRTPFREFFVPAREGGSLILYTPSADPAEDVYRKQLVSSVCSQ